MNENALDKFLATTVMVLWLVLGLSLVGLAYQKMTAPTYDPPGSVRGSLRGPSLS